MLLSLQALMYIHPMQTMKIEPVEQDSRFLGAERDSIATKQ